MARGPGQGMSGPRILVVHAWLKGNLGDVLQLSVLLSALRELKPRTLDLAGYPRHPATETQEVLALADRYIADAFPWYWSLTPAKIGTAVVEPWWRKRRAALFSHYDAVVCAPGPYLADYDPRAVSALADIAVARELGLSIVLASHSIGPLGEDGLRDVGRASVRVAREPATYRYLREHGVCAVQSADLAFLYPYERADRPVPVDDPYGVVFLRSNNLDADRLRLDRGTLYDGERPIAQTMGRRIVLATTDYRRDRRFLSKAARSLRAPSVICHGIPDLVRLIGGSSGVVSDRYHPAICAAVLGKPARVIANREPHKMTGLQDLLAGGSLEQFQALARAGLDAVRAALQTAA